ncbi:alpha/beta fold hydrolase [Roseivivax sediminis]|uniref:Pimeloyl-ACP methyl ester carboxylesterase n=1 Tax=Roseivivax sediminis TaxID=936889 RepID=A0A1I2BQX7_9RHOB|nr:alpha/beta hydrolase [Roseivivax sediminis]SFE57650.1 Pimeloyl-ACP methyl ester carboxylesterase [Roseivivax sediminis]
MPEDMRAGQPVHWRTFGAGPAPALLLHCALGQSKAWTPLAEALGDLWTAAAPDMPGHGQSGPWDGQSDLHDLVTAIAETFVTGPLHLVGHSFGATVALRLAEAMPQNVRSLTLIEPVLFAAAREAAPEAFAARLADEEAVAEAARAGDWALAAQRFTARWGAGPGWDKLPGKARDKLAAQMPLVRSTGPALYDDSKGLLVSGALERVTAPVRLIRGADTDPAVAAIHAGLMARLPDARETVVPGAGHMVPLTHASEVAKVLRGDLAG